MEFNVTSLVTGNGTYSFVLATDNTDGLDMASRETGTPPQLVVVFSGTSSVVSTAPVCHQPQRTVLPTRPQLTATVQAPTPSTPAAGSGLQGDYYSDNHLAHSS